VTPIVAQITRDLARKPLVMAMGLLVIRRGMVDLALQPCVLVSWSRAADECRRDHAFWHVDYALNIIRRIAASDASEQVRKPRIFNPMMDLTGPE
jgi:hypothetical protein